MPNRCIRWAGFLCQTILSSQAKMPTMEKSQSKNTCDLVSSLWTLMLIVMFEEYKDDVSFKL